jgi:acetyl esterase/lipase
MTWYREQYFGPHLDVTTQWTASPCFASLDLLKECPKTFIAVAECDLLVTEGIEYGQRLAEAGVSTEVKVYKGATHSVLVLAGVHEIGKQLVHDICERLAAELGVSYDRTAATIESQ